MNMDINLPAILLPAAGNIHDSRCKWTKASKAQIRHTVIQGELCILKNYYDPMESITPGIIPSGGYIHVPKILSTPCDIFIISMLCPHQCECIMDLFNFKRYIRVLK